MRRLLVTGGAGFIGSNFVHYWLRSHPGDRIVVLDALTYAGCAENLSSARERSELCFVKGDICDARLVGELMREERIDTVVHMAAESHVDRSIAGPGAFIQTNLVGTHTLLEEATRVWRERLDGGSGCRFHNVSTDEVYGSLGPEESAFTETVAYRPNSPYSASKAGADHLVRAYHVTYGLPVTISNCSNNYGPYQFPEKLIPLVVLNALSGRPLPIYGDGQNVRDWLFVEDHCEALARILSLGRVGHTYNIGANCELTNLALVQRICGLLDRLCPDSPYRPHARLIQRVTDRPGHDRRYAIDSRKLRDELGWRPHKGLDAGLHKTIAWYRDNAEWITDCWRVDAPEHR